MKKQYAIKPSKMVKILFFPAIFIWMLYIVGLPMHSAMAAEFNLRMHQFLPKQANSPKHVLERWAKQVMEASNGRINITHYPSMQLGGKPTELYDQAIDGVADIIWTLLGYTKGRFPISEAFELPFMMNTPEATSKAFYQYAQEFMMQDELKDVYVIGLWVHGPGVIHSKRPIRQLADMKGLKIRGPTRVSTILFENLGAEPIGMPVPAVPEYLARGVLDATALPWEVTETLKVPELVHHHTDFPNHALYTATFIFAMNKERYESFPPDLQKIIDDHSGLAFSGFAGRTQASFDAAARQKAVDQGNDMIELSPKDVQRWVKAAQPTIEQWVQEMDDKGYDGAMLLKRARKLIQEHQSQ